MVANSGNMMTPSNGKIFHVAGPLCGEFTGHRRIPFTRASDADIWFLFFNLRLNKRLSNEPWGWWFETPSRSWWRHCNETTGIGWTQVDVITGCCTYLCTVLWQTSWESWTPHSAYDRPVDHNEIWEERMTPTSKSITILLTSLIRLDN